ncbi:MAG: hypothetical protein HOV83_28765 [Catenulispora sp.]|nr:hypothetical protein [Catenulispora sp.]
MTRVLTTFAAATLLSLQPVAALAAAAPEKPAAPMVQPNPAAAGARIWIAGAACTSPAGTATSPALTAPIALTADKLNGPGILRDDLISGTYTLTLHCGGTRTTTVRVIADTGNAGVVTPHIETDDGSASDHLGIGDAALGSAFVLGAIAFGTASIVRRRRAAERDLHGQL